MDGCLSERARQGHNLGPGSVLGAKGKTRGEMAVISEQSELSGKLARLASLFACQLPPPPLFPWLLLQQTCSHFPRPPLPPYRYLVYMLWFNFILGLNFISFCFGEW